MKKIVIICSLLCSVALGKLHEAPDYIQPAVYVRFVALVPPYPKDSAKTQCDKDAIISLGIKTPSGKADDESAPQG